MCTLPQKENRREKKCRLLGGGKNTELLDVCAKSSVGHTKATGICLTSTSSLLVISTKTWPFSWSGHLAGIPVLFDAPQRASCWDTCAFWHTSVGISLGCLCLLTHLSRHLPGMCLSTHLSGHLAGMCLLTHLSGHLAGLCLLTHLLWQAARKAKLQAPLYGILPPTTATQVSKKLAVSQLTVFCCYSHNTSLVTDTWIMCFFIIAIHSACTRTNGMV